LDIILEGPQGQRALLMSDAGGGTDVSGINLTFDPTAATVLPDTSPPALTTATFRPANYGLNATVFTDTFPALCLPSVATTATSARLRRKLSR